MHRDTLSGLTQPQAEGRQTRVGLQVGGALLTTIQSILTHPILSTKQRSTNMYSAAELAGDWLCEQWLHEVSEPRLTQFEAPQQCHHHTDVPTESHQCCSGGFGLVALRM